MPLDLATPAQNLTQRPTLARGDAKESLAFQFGAKHTGVVNFVRADGSTQSISRDVATQTMMRLSGSADGLVIPEF